MAALAMQPDDMMEDGDGATATKDNALSDEDLLRALAAEKENSIGFENSSVLEEKRRLALDYYKGDMSDVKALPNRSRATSTDVADAIETVLPDLMEIFTGGEDVATFTPHGQEDEEGAAQETDYVNFVAFQKLNGFMLLYTAIKDALLTDTGVLDTWWADKVVTQTQTLEGVTLPQLAEMSDDGTITIVSVTPRAPGSAPPAGPMPMQGAGQPPMDEAPVEMFDVVIEQTHDEGSIQSMAVDPSNITVGRDTVMIDTAVYAAVRTFPRAQALTDMGFDPDKVAQLPEYSLKRDEQTEQSRDLAGESTATAIDGSGVKVGHELASPLRTVEVHKHWLRIDADGDGETELWRIHTDAECKIILDKRKVERIGLSVGTPFIQTHRFYGMSLADKLMEVQKIKTALLRLMLDSGYFAMNQRVEVSVDQANADTIKDLLRNEPGMPVRSKTGSAIRPLQAGQLGFDPHMALEYLSTMGESRSGVVRNAQGLNPDTLHDTAKGAMALMTMAQKRVRMIARVFAETLVKKWFLDIHALSRAHATRPEKIRLRGKWVDVDPSQFGSRADMVIQVGVGSGGRDQELQVMQSVLNFQEKIWAGQGMKDGPLLKAADVYNALKRFCERAGLKAPEMFFSDPAQYEAPEEAEQEDPALTKVKAEAQAKAQAAQFDAQMQQQKAQSDAEARIREIEINATLRQEEMDRTFALKEKQMEREFQLKERQLVAEMNLQRELEMAKIASGYYAPKQNGMASSGVHMGGEPG